MCIKQKARYFTITLLLTTGIMAPAFADDTELLLTTPPNVSGTPNILFILDSSGSMNTLEHTVAFYESNIQYSGDCDNSSFYWSDSGTIPACAGNNRVIDKTSLVCSAAKLQVAGVGSYTGILAQYRTGEFGSGERWQSIADNAPKAIVECQEDSGIHGDGSATLVYAQAGTDVAQYTDNPASEVAWGSAPLNQNYVLYDGNYLNWRANPGESDLTRLDIVKTILKKVLTVYNDINIGLMRFNNTQGGPVVHTISDLATNRAIFDAKLDDIEGSGNTPLSETFYEGALYWQGLPAHFGELIDQYPTDPNALASTGPEVYLPPASLGGGSCPRNFNILLTDGLPTQDADTIDLAPTLPEFAEILGRTQCNYDPASTNDDGQCLDDIGEYLFKKDISPASGRQTVKTYGVGFLASQDDFTLTKKTTEVSGGKFFLATDPESLATSLLSIFEEITEQSLTFTSPAVAVNAFNRTQHLNDLYMTVFKSKAQVHWPGNVKKYRVVNRTITDANGAPAVDPVTGFFTDTATSFWTTGSADGAEVELGGAANQLPDPSNRNLYTYNGSDKSLTSAANAISPSNASAFSFADFGLTGAKSEPSIDDMIRWARGEDIKDVDGIPSTTRRNAMGDPLHSQPAAIDYGSAGTSDVVVYAATNDGYLHAIDGRTGVELWSFIPKELMPNLFNLYVDPASKYKNYGIDGDIVPVVTDFNRNGEVDGADTVYIIFGMRRGGNRYFAIDVTNKNSPELLWNVAYPEFGQSWSTPTVARVNTTAAGINSEKAVVILGAGYDTVHDSPAVPTVNDGEGAGIFMLDLVSGNEIWRAGSDSGADLQLSTMNRAFPTRITVVDINGDKFADRMYAADIGGQVWRFDITSGEAPANLVAGGIIGRLGLDGSTRRVYNAPDVSIFSDPLQERRFISVSIGTGYRAHPLNTDSVDRFYSLRDPDVFKQLSQAEYDNYDVAVDADLIEVSGKTKVIVTSNDRGWKFTMPSNQMVLADSLTFDDNLFFVGFAPDVNNISDCEATIGRNFLYKVSIVNGDPVVNNLDTLDPADSDPARVTTLQQGGIAPRPTILFPSPDDPNCAGADCAPPPIGCVGIECFDPGFANNPVRTLWTQDGIE